MKKFSKVLAMVMVALMMMSTVAFAATEPNKDGISSAPEVGANDMVTVVLSGFKADEEATILVVDERTELKTLENDDIIYIDQLTVKDGTVTFKLDASKASVSTDKETKGRKAVDIYCGYSSMTDEPVMETVVLAEGGQEVEIIYGDVNGDTKADATDAGLVLQAFAKLITFTDSQALAADVNGDTKPDATDAGLILQKFAKLIDKFPVEDAQ